MVGAGAEVSTWLDIPAESGFGLANLPYGVAATVILVSSHAGYPLSTTQVVSGAVTGSGVGRPGALVNWGMAGRIVIGWILTLPMAGAWQCRTVAAACPSCTWRLHRYRKERSRRRAAGGQGTAEVRQPATLDGRGVQLGQALPVRYGLEVLL